jgi:hypothetical protein
MVCKALNGVGWPAAEQVAFRDGLLIAGRIGAACASIIANGTTRYLRLSAKIFSQACLGAVAGGSFFIRRLRQNLQRRAGAKCSSTCLNSTVSNQGLGTISGAFSWAAGEQEAGGKSRNAGWPIFRLGGWRRCRWGVWQGSGDACQLARAGRWGAGDGVLEVVEQVSMRDGRAKPAEKPCQSLSKLCGNSVEKCCLTPGFPILKTLRQLCREMLPDPWFPNLSGFECTTTRMRNSLASVAVGDTDWRGQDTAMKSPEAKGLRISRFQAMIDRNREAIQRKQRGLK